MKNPNVQIKSNDEIIITIPELVDEDEIVIDFDELGIDIENLSEDVNIIFQVEGDEEFDDDSADDDATQEPNEWYFDDDPYGIVYYEFPCEIDFEE